MADNLVSDCAATGAAANSENAPRRSANAGKTEKRAWRHPGSPSAGCSSDLWTSGPLDLWTSGPLDLWTSGPLDLWTSGPLDLWTSGPLDLWTSGPIILLPGYESYVLKLLFINCQVSPPSIHAPRPWDILSKLHQLRIRLAHGLHGHLAEITPSHPSQSEGCRADLMPVPCPGSSGIGRSGLFLFFGMPLS